MSRSVDLGKKLSVQQVRILVWMLENEDKSKKLPRVPWSPEAFLGHKPSKSESSSLSRALRTIEDRKLIFRANGFLNLTAQGRELAKKMRSEIGLGEEDIELSRELKIGFIQLDALELVMDLLEREYESVESKMRVLGNAGELSEELFPELIAEQLRLAKAGRVMSKLWAGEHERLARLTRKYGGPRVASLLLQRKKQNRLTFLAR